MRRADYSVSVITYKLAHVDPGTAKTWTMLNFMHCESSSWPQVAY